MSSGFPEAAVRAPDDLRVGLTAAFDHEITEEDVYAFARLSGDANPLHVDAAYADRTNFGGRLVHGAYQVGLASALVGMHLPGQHVLLGSISARFPAPLYYPCRVIVSGELTAWNAAARTGTVRVTVREASSQLPTAEMQLLVSWHERRDGRPAAAAAPARRSAAGTRDVVLVTGASGGVGSGLVASLADEYTVVAMARRTPALESAGEHVIPLQGDLQQPAWRDALIDVLEGRRLYGIVHAAWPGHPQGSLLQVDPLVVRQQIEFATLGTIELARVLFAQDPPAGDGRGGRLVVLGSVAGTQDPSLSAASYSLGKAALEHTVRLLAPELARRSVTVNAVNPSFIPAGMNRQATERQQMKAASLVPMGRLCQPGDVAGLVRYLLSPDASFLSGQVIGLTGAQI